MYTHEQLFLTEPFMVPGVIPQQSRELLEAALEGLSQAQHMTDKDIAFATSHRCALRVAAAVIAASTTLSPAKHASSTARRRRSRPQNAWVLLGRHCPQLQEWAHFFAANASLRAAAESGRGHVTNRMADDMVREVLSFMRDAVRAISSMMSQPSARAS